MRSHLSIILLFFFISSFAWAQSSDNKSFDPNEEQRGAHFEIDDIGRLLLGARNRAYEDIADELFDRLASYNVGIPIGEFSTLIGQVNRKVYDNRDGTYSVLDLFGVKGVVAPGETLDALGVPLYAAVGAEHGYDFLDIRQYDNKLKIGYVPTVLLPDDPWYADLWNGVRARWFGARYIYDAINGTFNTVIHFFRSPSDEFLPRYENLLNIVRTPFRLPLSRAGFVNLEPGEIVSDTITGGVFLSAGVGWKESVFSSNFGVSLYKRGAVRVTILKERNGNFAKIKLSHLASQGYSIGGKVRGETQIIEGIFFGSDLSVSMIPFRISMNTADIKIFDSVYRYDMRTPLGQEAYEKAVLGNFILSEEEGLKNQDISKLYDKDTKTKSNTFDMNYNLLIWRHQKRFQLDNSLITITDDEGVNHIFKSMSKNEVETGNLFHGRDEVFEYFIDTAFELEDPEHPIKSIDPAVSISILMSDRHAYGSQLRRHFQMMENILQDPQFFDEGQYAVETDYRKMSLQFTVNFYLNAIDHILEASPDDVWKAIAKAYGVSPSDWETEEKRNEWVNFETYFMGFLRIRSAIEKIRLMRNATEIVKYFGRIKSQVDPRERAMLLSQFHHDNGLDWHVLTVMLLLADKEDIYYHLSVQGKEVPTVDQSWGRVIPLQRPDLHEQDEKEMDGRSIVTRARIAEVKLSCSPSDKRLKFLFKTNVDPQTIEGFFIRMSKIGWWWFRNALLFQTPNDGELFKDFSYDDNHQVTLYLDTVPITEKLELGQRYELMVAFRQTNQIFSEEVKLIFTHDENENLNIQWIDSSGKSEILGY
ncbi:MAG: hypothetical protein A2Z91_01230 [Deltaproteobacteria bacterium GWA2_38_16]|nr:MAG: hypothetical protein A2Z91_01230 [Deltaproteobacteria bacterium GWA2_38_16]HBQ21965.1 hypothetical protein [Deltaproteobacteria bacterium]